MIKDVHDVWEHSHREHVKVYSEKPGWRFKPPTEVDSTAPAVQPIINHGRWVVLCPYCPGAEMLDKQDLVFFCISCRMEQIGGKYITVEMPDGWQDIEELTDKSNLNVVAKNWPEVQ